MLLDVITNPADLATRARAAFTHGSRLLAARLAWTPAGMLSQYLSNKTERENPPTGKFIEVDGVRLHYFDRGTGAPIVLLHGNGTMAYEWEVSSLLEMASEKYRVLAFDRPGYGYSARPRGKAWTAEEQAALLFKALKALGVESATVVGHSWGTLPAVSLALAQPGFIRSLVLLSGYYYPAPRLDVMLLSPPAIPGFGDVIRPTLSPYIGRMMWPALIQKFFSPAPVTARWNATFPVWMTLRPSQILASATETALMTAEAFWMEKRYHELNLPVVIMAGRDDVHVATTMHSERLHRQLPQSTLVVLPDTGHMIHHVAPEKVLEAIDMAAR